MESTPDRSTSSESRTPARVPDGGKLTRIASHTQGLVEDLREWIDLRIDLAILDLEERANEAKNKAAQGVVLAVLAFFTGLFALTTLAIGLGWALGHPFWGFLIVFAVLAVITIGIANARPAIGPPITLFEDLRPERGRPAESDSEDDRPARKAKATVDEARPPDASSPSSSGEATSQGR